MVIATLRGYNFCNKSESRKANKAVKPTVLAHRRKGLVDLLLVYLLFGLLVGPAQSGQRIGLSVIGVLVHWFIGLLVYRFVQEHKIDKKEGTP